MSEDRCICCGDIVPEGRMVCPNCEKQKPMKNLSHGEMVQIAEEKKNKTPRYIDANRLIDLATHEGAYGYVDVHDIYSIPVADVVERKKGRWIKNDFYEDALMCSCCNAYLDKEDWGRHYFYFCYHCGAFMEGMDVGEEKTDG